MRRVCISTASLLTADFSTSESNKAAGEQSSSRAPLSVVELARVRQAMNEQEARDTVKQAEDETGLPATDVVRFGVGVLINSLSNYVAF